jgi:hypothetical protein
MSGLTTLLRNISQFLIFLPCQQFILKNQLQNTVFFLPIDEDSVFTNQNIRAFHTINF